MRQLDIAAEVEIDERTYRRYESGQVNTGSSTTNYTKQYENLRGLAAFYELEGPEVLLDTPAETSHHEPRPAPLHTARTAALQPPDAPYDTAWYVHRTAEERRAMNRLRGPGAPVVLQAPQLYGKSTLLGYLLEEVRRGTPDCRCIRLNLGALSRTQLASFENVLLALARSLLNVDEWAEAPLLSAAWQRAGSELNKLMWLLEQLLSKESLIVALEKADAIHGLPYQDDFFAMLRSWAERGTSAPWSRLRLLVSVATEPSLLECIDHSSFFVLANPIRLDGFSSAQAAEMARLYGLSPSAPELAALMLNVGGNPYLLRLALYECVVNECTLAQVLADSSGGIFASHLLRQRGWLQSEKLLSAIQMVLSRENTELPFDQYCQLYSKGLIYEPSTEVYLLRSELYEQYSVSYVGSSSRASSNGLLGYPRNVSRVTSGSGNLTSPG